MGIKNDYRVSAIVVLCKDCNQDVGLYPARHQCSNAKKLPTLYSSTSNSSWETTSQKPHNDYSTPKPTHKTSRNLWGKVRENEKWKELVQAEKKSQQEEKQSTKLWEKLINVTMSNNSSYDDCPESDDDDWEGETHVSRILREHYERCHKPLPEWLLNDELSHVRSSRKLSRKLWEQDETGTTSRQKELLEIRKSNGSNGQSYSNDSYTPISQEQQPILSPTTRQPIQDTLKTSSSSYTLHPQPEGYNTTIKNSHSMPNVNESTNRPKSERKPSNFASVKLSMNNSIRHLYPKKQTNSKYQYVSTSAKS